MATFLFLHGAWHGGWAWEEVAGLLRRSGHRCHAPDLPGVEPGRRTGLLEHVECAEQELRPLAPAVVVAHSYSGVVAQQLQSRRPRDVAGVVHVETMIPEDGESFFDLVSAETRSDYRERARWNGVQWVLPPTSDVSRLGVTDPTVAALLRARLRPQPMDTFLEPAVVAPMVTTPPQTYVYAEDRASSPFQEVIDRCAVSDGWEVVGLPGGHEMMLTNPDGLASVLDRVALRTRPPEALR